MTRSNKTLWCVFAALVLVGCANAPAVKPGSKSPSTGTAATDKPPKDTAPVVVVEKDPATQFEEALTALKAKKTAEARAGFEILAKKHPEFSGPLTNLAILDTKTPASRAAAAGNFSRAVAANPRNAIALNWLGILYREAKDYTRAEQSYQQSLAVNPDNAAVVLNLAILNDVYLKRPAEALNRYRDYQRMTNNRELKVAAWIKAIEATQVPAAPAAAPATATSAVPKT